MSSVNRLRRENKGEFHSRKMSLSAYARRKSWNWTYIKDSLVLMLWSVFTRHSANASMNAWKKTGQMLCLGLRSLHFCLCLQLRNITDRRAIVLALCKVGLVCASAMKSRLFAGFPCNNSMHTCKFENDIPVENTNGEHEWRHLNGIDFLCHICSKLWRARESLRKWLRLEVYL